VHGFEDLYCVGWTQTGPKGVIASTVQTVQIAFENFKNNLKIKEDIESED